MIVRIASIQTKFTEESQKKKDFFVFLRENIFEFYFRDLNQTSFLFSENSRIIIEIKVKEMLISPVLSVI